MKMVGLSRCFMFVCIGFLFGMCLTPSSAELERFEYPTKGIGSISFLVVGDWGRRGAYNQSKVAHQMGKVADNLQIDFVISTGDNFYENGLTSVDDPAFLESFTKIYTAKSLHTQWYSVLGNHDYRGNVEAQLSPVLAQTDSRWFCKRSFVLDGEIAEFFFVDTTPFVEKYFLKPRKHKYDWRGVLPRKQYLANLTKDLDLALKGSKAYWKIVVGHHTIKSIGHHGHTMELELKLLPILKANNVDMYINGHDHCLQHISSRTSNIHFLTSGGGSKAWKGDIKKHKGDGPKFYYDGQGFVSVQLTQTNVKAMFHDVSGKVLYDLTYSKALSSAV